MGFYDLTKEERVHLVAEIQYHLLQSIKDNNLHAFQEYCSNEDTYIRKAAYQNIGKIYNTEIQVRTNILNSLVALKNHPNELVRQTVINAAGEIGMLHFSKVMTFFDEALFDDHPKVRNAVIGSLKKMGQKNPIPTLDWATQYLEHPDKEVRREICHGIELRGRTHPQDILPLLAKLQNDDTKRVRDTLVHVLGQISYKKGCLPTVVTALNGWKNKKLVQDAADEIVDVHSEQRYAKFSALSQEEVVSYLSKHLKN